MVEEFKTNSPLEIKRVTKEILEKLN